MDPIDPIRPVGPTWSPLDVLHPYDHPKQPQPPIHPVPPPHEEETPAFVLPPAAPVLPGKTLRQVLLDAGVRGIGPVGPGYALSPRELAAALLDAYKYLGRSAYHALADRPTLGREIGSALAADPRGEREVGLMLILYPRLAESLETVYGPGQLNRWRQAGEYLQAQLAERPQSIVGDLQLVEPPGQRHIP